MENTPPPASTSSKQDKKDILMYEYFKKRREFGKQTLFEDQGPELIVNIPGNAAVYGNYVLRNPVHVAIQNTGTTSEHWVNSER